MMASFSIGLYQTFLSRLEIEQVPEMVENLSMEVRNYCFEKHLP